METRILTTQPCKNGGATLQKIDNVLCQQFDFIVEFFQKL
jgi:hypothetical protein